MRHSHKSDSYPLCTKLASCCRSQIVAVKTETEVVCTVTKTMKPPIEQNSRREGGGRPQGTWEGDEKPGRSESTGSYFRVCFFIYPIQSYPQEWEKGSRNKGGKTEAVLYERLFILIM